MKVLICEDVILFRKGLKHFLESSDDELLVDEAGDRSDLLKRARSEHYDVLLLDISMSNQNGLDLLKTWRQIYPEIPVLILNRYVREEDAVRALRAGAAGYMSQQATPEELIQSIYRLNDGHRYISHLMAERLADLVSEEENDPIQSLSDREYQVLIGIASGKSVAEIAGELFLSGNTISTYRKRLFAKLNLQNSAQLIRYALKHKLVD